MLPQESSCLIELAATGDFTNLKPLQVAHTASGSSFFTGTFVASGEHCFIKQCAGAFTQGALKEIEFMRAIKNEVERANCKNIDIVPPFKHYCLNDGSLVLVTKFLEGLTLEEMRLRREVFDFATASTIQNGLCEWAQIFLKIDIAHRDVHPKNFMFANNKLILIDFQTAIKKQNPVFKDPSVKELRNLGSLGAGHSPKRGTWNDIFSLARVYEDIAHLMPLEDNIKTIQYLFDLSKNWTTLKNEFIVTETWKKKIKRDYLKVLLRPAWTCKPKSRTKRAYVLETIRSLLRDSD